MDALADLDALESRLGRPLTGQEASRAAALLADASAVVRAYTLQDFQRVDHETVVLRGQLGEIRLPQRPVIDVTAVVALGAGGAPDIPVVGWQWDGLDIVRTAPNSPVINLPELWYEDDVVAYPSTYRVTYSHGQTDAPADVVAVVASMALRTLTAPTLAGGVTGETIGPYSYRTDGSGVGTGIVMTQADQQILARYRRKQGMSMARFR
ncbi:hypothetical protein [Streptomyces sp. NPDC056670]|uniref:hypothetical protein n=1 Tax=Streptomyces sp. NPDC056670 TaxID=3345904 RepID=UPI003693150E